MERSTIIGYNSEATASHSVVIGCESKTHGKNSAIIGNGIDNTEDDKVIIGTVDVSKLLERVEKLEQLVEHLWWMPGGPEAQAGELRFNATIEKLVKNRDT